MELLQSLKDKGYLLVNVDVKDVAEFVCIEKETHNKYVVEHCDFFGEWNEDLLKSAFNKKMNTSFFQKIIYHDEIVGFLGYDKKNDKIDEVFIRLTEKVQNQKIGTYFLSNLIKLSKEFGIPIFLAVIKTNPARNLYKRMGFVCYEEKNVFYFFRYNPIVYSVTKIRRTIN